MNESSIAIHEAGHAVACYRMGFYIGTTTIVPTDDTAGSQTGEGECIDGSRDLDQVIALYAGGAAQRIHDPACDLSGCERDDSMAADLLRSNPDASEGALRQQADALLRKHWAEVKAIATALQEDKTLTGEEVEMIMLAVEEGEDWRVMLETFRQRERQWRSH